MSFCNISTVQQQCIRRVVYHNLRGTRNSRCTRRPEFRKALFHRASRFSANPANFIIEDKDRSIASGFMNLNDLDFPFGFQDVDGIGNALSADMYLSHHRKP